MTNYVKKITCKLCNGSKKCNRLGGLIGECIECEGLGVVFDIKTDEEIKEQEEKEKIKLALEKSRKKEKLIHDIASRLTGKNTSISFEEAKKIAEEELSKDEEFKDEISNVEKSRKPRKKKEEIFDSLESNQPKIILEQTVSENLLD